MNTPIKLALSAISVGGITVGAGFGIHYLSKETNNENIKITKLLEAEKDIVLISENGDDNAWATTWNKFKTEHQGKTLSIDWADLRNKLNEESVPAEFKKSCKSNSQKTIKNSSAPVYKEIKNYCTKAKTQNSLG